MIEVSPARFEEMVEAALDSLPERLGRLMSNVAVMVQHEPGPPGLLDEGVIEGKIGRHVDTSMMATHNLTHR